LKLNLMTFGKRYISLRDNKLQQRIHNQRPQGIEKAMEVVMKDPFKYTNNDLYELMDAQGKKRFGSECKHEHVRNGRCLNCLRKVIVKMPTR